MTKLILHFIILATVISCLPQNPNSTREQSNSTTDTNSDTTIVTHPYSVYWSSSENYPTSISINSNIATSIYLRGTQIDKFLRNKLNYYVSSNKLMTYCVAFSFNSNGAKSQLRIKALPQQVVSLDGKSERRLRVLFDADESENMAACQGDLTNYLSTSAAYTPSKLCPNCALTFSSQKVSLYASYSGIADQYAVATSSVGLSALSIVFDPSGNTTGEGTTCSDSQCKAIDKDCCLNGQCVDHGAEKPNASADPNYLVAKASVAADPKNLYKWESIYFICPNYVPDDSGNTNPDPVDPNLQLQKELADLNCLAGYSTNNYSSCTRSPSFVAPGTLADYKYVKGYVLKICGCSHEQNSFPPYNASPFCSDWALEKVTNASGTVTGTRCYAILDDENTNTGFENTSLSLSGKTVPHRFYEATSGLSLDKVEGLSASVVQEGESFSYQDNLNKTDPQNGSFNMNSVLGQMLVDLSQSIPAKAVNVDYQQTYLITVSTGSYTPCVKCVADSWYSNYYAHPANLGRFGLTPSGYQTSRMGDDAPAGARGNYEDTIFGRACWVPPTMIPFSHAANSDLQTQRLNRLKTQAALFINGYQRDWYGFNKGAVIGSFDGVSWFAVGASRRITSTSNRLFLAINAPFGDLASSSTLSVQITKDNSNANAAEFDYDPNLELNDPEQNPGASCQRYHYCEKDSDCVTKLGWEYTCADTSVYRTRWPIFDASAKEKANSEISKASFYTLGKILHGVPDTTSKKRCIYRGAGAPCKANYSELTTIQQKLFTCAPNFYCSNLSNDDFNSEIARTPGQLDVILYGQEADVLGRPLNYITRVATSGLSSAISTNIKHNAEIFSSNTGDWGLCRPGKRLSAVSLDQHRYSDNAKRTDYISQISSCDSSLIGSSRASSCPTFESNESSSNFGNYLSNGASPYLTNNIQNMCGSESQSATGESAFSSIESKPLTSLFYILKPTLAQDACLRRAGAVCHTDLDCGPNKLHAQEAARRGISYFGNTKAEQQFWQESLVCGQAEADPKAGTDEFANYDMSKNRCCRAIGNSISLYTQADLSLQDKNADATLSALQVAKFPYNDPKATGRYSRYATVGKFGPGTDPTVPYYGEPRVDTTPAPGIKPGAYQWKTINDTATRTCCGGGWVRKFADGTTSWNNLSRLSLNISNFACLNYQNEIATLAKDELPLFNIIPGIYREKERLCERVSTGGCIEYPIRLPDLFEIKLPEYASTSTATLNTTPMDHDGTIYQDVSREAPYMPSPLRLGYAKTVNYFYDVTYEFVSFYLPIYLGGRTNFNSVKIQYVGVDGNGKRVVSNADLFNLTPYAGTGVCTFADNNPIGDLAVGEYCVDNTSSALGAVFHARANTAYHIASTGVTWAQAGIVINFDVANTINFIYNPDLSAAEKAQVHGMKAGNAMYYLTKLGRLELTGIPQIVYEPIYCNSNRDKLVEGIFKSTIETRSDFYNNSFYYASAGQKSLAQIYDQTSPGLNPGSDPQNPNEEAVFGDKLQIAPIFSASEMKCCIKLGNYSPDYRNCCTSYGVWDNTKNQYQCLLPSGADLNVYLNRFVSGEGTDLDDEELRLKDTDFIPETGEPKLDSAVYDKIKAIGELYCASKKVKKGSAFGYYNAGNANSFITVGNEEDSSCLYRQYQMVDSNTDNETTESCYSENGTIEADDRNGYNNFLRGFRWNHHYYCAPFSE